MKAPSFLRTWSRAAGRRSPPGTAPGTIRSDPDAAPAVVQVMAYGRHEMTEVTIDDLELLRTMCGKWPVLWVNVDGVGDAETVRRIGEIFGLHRLALEDVVNTHQRAKAEEYDTHMFVVAQMAEPGRTGTEQVGIFLGKDFVITFQERTGDPFDPVRERIRAGSARLRSAGPDYLAYTVIDAIVDYYFPLLEGLGDRLDTIEDEVLGSPTRDTMAAIHRVKRELVSVRRAVWPMREAMNALIRNPCDLITDDTRVHLRDCYDHVVQVIDLVETYRDVGSSLTDVYLSSMSNRLNEIMKVLTLFSAIFIPLGFIAGVYGMNFNDAASPLNMPELDWYWGYPFALGIMATVALGLLVFFWRKGWIGGD